MNNTRSPSLKSTLIASFALHFMLLFLMVWSPSQSRPVLERTARNDSVHVDAPLESPSPVKAITATSVDAKQVEAVMRTLVQAREKKAAAEAAKQRALEAKAEQARLQRVAEQQRLKQLQAETLAKQKHLQEESARLAKLKVAQETEQKRLLDVKKNQAVEAAKLAELKKQQALQVQKEQAALAEKAKAAAQAKAQEDVARKARLAGEVNRYKALIINAISRQWILPDDVDDALSSQFKIRLAPDGAVLEAVLTRSSGDSVLDRSAEAAIHKASPLPVPSDSETFNLFREISLTVRPEQGRG